MGKLSYLNLRSIFFKITGKLISYCQTRVQLYTRYTLLRFTLKVAKINIVNLNSSLKLNITKANLVNKKDIFNFKSYYVCFVIVFYGLSSLGVSADQCLPHYFTQDQSIKYLGLSDYVLSHGDWYDVIVPTENGFEYKKVNSWHQVVELFKNVPQEKKEIIRNLLWHAEKKMEDLVNHFKPYAKKYKAHFEARIKDIGSLKIKILNKASSRNFSLNELNDLMGFRFIVSSGSELINFEKAVLQIKNERQLSYEEALYEFFAMELGIKRESLIQVELKGTEAEMAKGRYYRSIHLALRPDEQTRGELQIMTDGMHFWHSWDHKKVYKNKIADKDYLSQLKAYSTAWVKIIRLIEDIENGTKNSSEFYDFIKEFSLNKNLHPLMLAQVMDTRIATHFNIELMDRITIEKNKVGKYSYRVGFMGYLFRKLDALANKTQM